MTGQSGLGQNNAGSPQNDRSSSWMRVFVSVVLIILSILPQILYQIRVIPSQTEASAYTVGGLIVTGLSWVFPFHEVTAFFQRIIFKIKRFARRSDVLISYNIADYSWAIWIEWQLNKRGYSTILKDWDAGSNNFEKEMREVSKEAKCIITIFSPDYKNMLDISKFETKRLIKLLQKLKGQGSKKAREMVAHLPVLKQKSKVDRKGGVRKRQKPAWLHNLKKQNRSGAKSIITFVCTSIYEEYKSEFGSSINLAEATRGVALSRLMSGVSSKIGKRDGSSSSILSPDLEEPHFPGNLPHVWNVPSRNPFFTGREDDLNILHTALQKNRRKAELQAQAIFGLGGIGKTR